MSYFRPSLKLEGTKMLKWPTKMTMLTQSKLANLTVWWMENYSSCLSLAKWASFKKKTCRSWFNFAANWLKSHQTLSQPFTNSRRNKKVSKKKPSRILKLWVSLTLSTLETVKKRLLSLKRRKNQMTNGAPLTLPCFVLKIFSRNVQTNTLRCCWVSWVPAKLRLN